MFLSDEELTGLIPAKSEDWVLKAVPLLPTCCEQVPERREARQAVGTPLCPYGVAYRRVYGLSASGLFKTSLCNAVCLGI